MRSAARIKKCTVNLAPLAALALLVFSVQLLPATSIGQDKSATSEQPRKTAFTNSIAPVLKKNCSPCHFEGGKVFDRYPFDKYETVRRLGARLNSRLKGENAELVTRWIADGSPER